MKRFLTTILAATLFSAPLMAQTLTEADVKRLALEAILENPDIIMQAVEILQARDQQAASDAAASVLSDQRILLEQDPNAPVLGNPDGDVTVVEFFDYNCPYCRAMAPELKALIETDPGLRLVMREWPILSEGSVYAAQVALAARNQGKYAEFHSAMMELRGNADQTSTLRVAREIGLDIEQLQADMAAPEVQEHIQTSLNLAERLGFQGTPSFVIGDALVPGSVATDELEQLIADARARP